MDCHGAGRPQGRGGVCFHGVGRPQERGETTQKCRRCFRVGRGSNGGCNRGWKMEEVRGDSAEVEIKRECGPYCCHVGAGNPQGQAGKRTISKFEVEFLNRLQELELQARMIRDENLEHKKILTRLYNLAYATPYATHTEAKAQYQNIAEKVEHLEETLELAFPHKARKRKVSGKELEDINRKMEKLQKFMANEGNFVDLSAEKNGAVASADAAMDFGLQ